MSDIELLREAARLMRERATAATPSPWKVTDNRSIEAPSGFRGRVVASVGAYESGWPSTPDADHIASWHPAVALAVAAWLESEAELHAEILAAAVAVQIAGGRWRLRLDGSTLPEAVAVARSYLGRPE